MVVTLETKTGTQKITCESIKVENGFIQMEAPETKNEKHKGMWLASSDFKIVLID